MSTVINSAGPPNDPRIGPDQTSSHSPRRPPESDRTGRDTDAAKVAVSHHASAVSEKLRLAHSENVAAAAGSVEDINRASALVKTLAKQISDQPAAALSAQAGINAKSALNLLS